MMGSFWLWVGGSPHITR